METFCFTSLFHFSQFGSLCCRIRTLNAPLLFIKCAFFLGYEQEKHEVLAIIHLQN